MRIANHSDRARGDDRLFFLLIDRGRASARRGRGKVDRLHVASRAAQSIVTYPAYQTTDAGLRAAAGRA